VERKGSAKNDFDHRLYGPCPDCFVWLMMDTSLVKHRQSCVHDDKSKLGQTRKYMKIRESRVLSGQAERDEHSHTLVTKAVLPIMKKDNIFELVINDTLIKELGEMWMIKSYDNKLKRCKTSSFRMRLSARLVGRKMQHKR